MFGLFKRKTQADKLNDQYKKLLKEAHALSTSNRRASDQKMSEADEVLRQIQKLKESQ